jgi:3-deoxy-D-arabino-heptulosonate 7-phosphate (DAHP) synthase
MGAMGATKTLRTAGNKDNFIVLMGAAKQLWESSDFGKEIMNRASLFFEQPPKRKAVIPQY